MDNTSYVFQLPETRVCKHNDLKRKRYYIRGEVSHTAKDGNVAIIFYHCNIEGHITTSTSRLKYRKAVEIRKNAMQELVRANFQSKDEALKRKQHRNV